MKQAYLSELAGSPLKNYIKMQGYKVNLVDRLGRLYEYNEEKLPDPFDYIDAPTYVDPRIATHADIYMCQLGLWNEAGIFFGDPEKLTPDYPGDVIFNAVCTRDYYIHLIPGTDDDLVGALMMWRKQLIYNDFAQHKHQFHHDMEELQFGRQDQNEHVQVIGVNQGYTRCTCLPVDNRSFITSDDGLANILENQGASVLKITTGHIELPGFDYGFIGGCAGHIYVKNENPGAGLPEKQRAIVFNGDLSAHPDADKIIEFIQSRNIYPIFFKEYPLTDIGSILATE